MQEGKCRALVRGRSIAPFEEWHDALEMLPCERCGAWAAAPEMHHRKFRSRGGLWVPSNVVLLCYLCHRAATLELPCVRFTGVNVHSWEESTLVPMAVWHSRSPVLLDDLGGYREAA